jgi:DUF2934 family protein
MAKRPPARSQSDDTPTAAPAKPRVRRSRAAAPPPATASAEPAASPVQATRMHATADTPIVLDPDPSHETTRSESMGSEPSEHDIRMRAYHRYLERGGGHGMEFQDWVDAERELKAKR